QNRFFDVAISAEHFHGLAHRQSGSFTDPELECWRAEPSERTIFVAGVDLEGSCKAQRKQHRGVAFELEIWQHDLHQWIVDLPPAKRASISRVVYRLQRRAADQSRAADHAVEPGMLDHFQDDRDASAFIADSPAERLVELDFARGVGTVAELVLQT